MFHTVMYNDNRIYKYCLRNNQQVPQWQQIPSEEILYILLKKITQTSK